eukprot:EG_transcript_14958
MSYAPCRYFLAGYCRHGSLCPFQHSSSRPGPDYSVLRAPNTPESPQNEASEEVAEIVSEAELEVGSIAVSEDTAAVSEVTRQISDDTVRSQAVYDGDIEYLMCQICFSLLREPRQCINGHASCTECLQRCLQKKQECPVCRVHMQLNTAGRNLHLERQIDSLLFRCRNVDCTATFTREALRRHLEICPYRLILCACQAKVPNHTFFEHVTTCPMWQGGRDHIEESERRQEAERRIAELEAKVERLTTEAQAAQTKIQELRQGMRHLQEMKDDAEKDRLEIEGFANLDFDEIMRKLQIPETPRKRTLYMKKQAILNYIGRLQHAVQLHEAARAAAAAQLAQWEAGMARLRGSLTADVASSSNDH